MERTQGQDLYEVLQVSPGAHPVIITKAFRLLAALHHPDNQQTGDAETFKQLGHAYRILSDPVRRAAYDRERLGAPEPKNGSVPIVDDVLFPKANGGEIDEMGLRSLILQALYNVRRGRPYKPSLSLLVLAELAGCTIEGLQYTLWYLRGKRFIENADDSELAITVDGVDYIEGHGLGTNGVRTNHPTEAPIPLPFSREGIAESSLATPDHGSDNGRESGR